MKIYTKTGDGGETALFSGERVSKAQSQVEAYGSADELNSWLGYCAACGISQSLRDVLEQVQHDIHTLCTDLATSMDSSKNISRMSNERVERLEKWIDEFQADLPELKNFILAGGSEAAGRLHIARTVARRVERIVVEHSQSTKINPLVINYLNRLSDLLFVLARVANKENQVSDVLWDQTK